MRYLSLILFLSLSFLFYACQPDNLSAPEKQSIETAPEFYIAQAEEMVAETEAQVLEHPNYVAADNERRRAVVVPAGSTNALEAAIQAAGPFGKVILETGMHTESNTVMVTQPVRIIGQPGAVIKVSTTVPSDVLSFPYVLDPAIYVKGAKFVQIRNLTIQPDMATGQGSIGILVSNSDFSYIKGNRIEDHVQAVLVHESDFASIISNEAEGLYTEGFISFNSYGISVMSGASARIRGNNMNDFQGGYFTSDRNGVSFRNSASGGDIGFIYCNYLVDLVQLPDGTVIGANLTAENWLGVQNSGTNTLVAHLVIDGANNCTLVSNQGVNSGLYDVDFVGESTRTGFVTPTSFSNLFIAGAYPNTTVKDCGDDNTIIGGIIVPDSEVACF